jgi:hypothetical protein
VHCRTANEVYHGTKRSRCRKVDSDILAAKKIKPESECLEIVDQHIVDNHG